MGTGNVQLPPLQPQVAWDVEVEESHYSDEEFEEYTEEDATSEAAHREEYPKEQSPLINIPAPIMCQIIQYLDPDECKIFFLSLRSQSVVEDSVWMEAVTKVYGTASLNNRSTWKSVFMDCFSLEKAFYTHQETKFTEKKVKSFAFSFW